MSVYVLWFNKNETSACLDSYNLENCCFFILLSYMIDISHELSYWDWVWYLDTGKSSSASVLRYMRTRATMYINQLEKHIIDSRPSAKTSLCEKNLLENNQPLSVHLYYLLVTHGLVWRVFMLLFPPHHSSWYTQQYLWTGCCFSHFPSYTRTYQKQKYPNKGQHLAVSMMVTAPQWPRSTAGLTLALTLTTTRCWSYKYEAKACSEKQVKEFNSYETLIGAHKHSKVFVSTNPFPTAQMLLPQRHLVWDSAGRSS